MKKDIGHWLTSSEMLELTFHFYPKRWHERVWVQIALSILVGEMVLIGQFRSGLFPNLGISLVSAVAYVVVLAVDGYVTDAAMRLKPLFDVHGVEFPVSERNWLLPDYPTGRELFFSKVLLIDLGMLLLTLLMPAFGVTVIISRLCAILTNVRYKARLERVLMTLRGNTGIGKRSAVTN